MSVLKAGKPLPAQVKGEVKNLLGQVRLSLVAIDEAQFLSPEQVMQLCQVADFLGVPVMCYGLRAGVLGSYDLDARQGWLELLVDSYLRYIERQLRTAFDLGSTPIKLRVRHRAS